MKALLLLLFFLATPIFAQDFSYGEISDLKGLTKVYVDTGSDFKNRESILKDLKKSGLSLELVDDQVDAEILLVFGAGEVARKIVAAPKGAGAILRTKTQKTGNGWVVARARGKDRIVHSFEDVQQSGWERKPVTNFTREFVKIYKRANK